jgi:hypothetical protein
MKKMKEDEPGDDEDGEGGANEEGEGNGDKEERSENGEGEEEQGNKTGLFFTSSSFVRCSEKNHSTKY